MELILAIDLLDGRVVRLARGEFDAVTAYGDDPVAVARRWRDEGATRLHLVDLDAARHGLPQQRAIIERIVAEVGVPCQAAGGSGPRLVWLAPWMPVPTASCWAAP